MISFIFGVIIGCFMGVALMCLMCISKQDYYGQ
jgi:hypothetical protein